MQVGLFFGSFNPVHVGHMVLANYMLSFTPLQEVWLVVSPQNPLKDKSQLLDQQLRLNLVRTAINDHPRMRASNIEFGLSQPSFTIHTLAHLKERYPEHEFSIIIGEDNLKTFHKWKNYEEILRSYHLYVYPRHASGAEQFREHPHVHLTQAPVIDVSSTFIRNAIKEGKDVRFFLPPNVWEEIDSMNYYGHKEKF